MPIQSCTLPGGGSGWKWGGRGKCFASRADAERQAQAAYAAGYREKSMADEDIGKDFTASSVHAPTAIGNDSAAPPKKKPVKNKKPETEPFEILVDVDKRNDEQQIVYGWASVTHEGDSIVTDLQGDQIELAELSKAAHAFMLDSRVGSDMHKFHGVGHVVESMVFTPDVQDSLGISLGKSGWFIGMKIADEEVWKRVKSGELGAFSIGGNAIRQEAEES